MTIELSDLRKILSAPGMTTYRAPAVIQPAFITEVAFSVGDQPYPAVVTAGYLSREDGTFEINFDALGYSGPAPISLTINQEDIRAVREMLGIGKAFPLVDYENDDLAVALHALREIATAKEGITSADLLMSWEDIATATIDLAQKALEQIAEADNGTPSYSS